MLITIALGMSPAGFAQKTVPIAHTLTEVQLRKLAGSMYWDKQTKAVLGSALKPLLGERYAEFNKAFHTTTPLRYENGRLFGSGFFGPISAALEFQVGGALAAAINDGQKCVDYGPVNLGYLCEEINR